MASPHSWRPVIAALINDTLRDAFARVVSGDTNIDAASRARLLQSGLLRSEGETVSVDLGHLRAILSTSDGRPPKEGVERFLTIDGTIDRYPAQQSERLELFQFIAERIAAPGEHFTEIELNTRLAPWDDDVARLRRHLVDEGLLRRSPDGRDYLR